MNQDASIKFKLKFIPPKPDIKYIPLNERILEEALEEKRKEVKQNDIKNLVVCVGNKGYFNFN